MAKTTAPEVDHVAYDAALEVWFAARDSHRVLFTNELTTMTMSAWYKHNPCPVPESFPLAQPEEPTNICDYTDTCPCDDCVCCPAGECCPECCFRCYAQRVY